LLYITAATFLVADGVDDTHNFAALSVILRFFLRHKKWTNAANPLFSGVLLVSPIITHSYAHLEYQSKLKSAGAMSWIENTSLAQPSALENALV